jgi:hypothetical protein
MAKKKICRVDARLSYVTILRSESGGIEDVSSAKIYTNPSPTALFLLSRACNTLALNGEGTLTAPLFRPEEVGWTWTRQGALSSTTMAYIMEYCRQKPPVGD